MQRVSVDSLTSASRVKADDLTPLEREVLEQKGAIGPEGFVDIAAPEAPTMVDPKATERKKAVASLNSVVQGPPAVPPRPASAVEPVYPEVDVEKYTKEIAELRKQVESRSPCPRCGLGIQETCEVKPSKQDLEDFLKCVLSGELFAKDYNLFGGALQVRLQTRNGFTEEVIRKAVTAAMRDREISTEHEIFTMIKTLTLAAAMKTYRSTKYVDIDFPEIKTDDVAAFRKAAEERVNKIPAPVQVVLRQVFTQFNELVDVMTQRAQDPSFWVGTPV